jgi:hypothetical protein
MIPKIIRFKPPKKATVTNIDAQPAELCPIKKAYAI